MMVNLLSNDHKVWIFHFRLSLMPRELTYAVMQAMCTDDDKEADKAIEPSSDGSRPSDMLAHVMMSWTVCSRRVCRQ